MYHPLADVLRDLSRWFNYAEVAIWPVMGLVLVAAGFRRAGVVRRDYWLAAAVLIAFGPTDYFEAEHGNEWWRPWWLLLWKAACVAALLAIVGNAWRRERLRGPGPQDGTADDGDTGGVAAPQSRSPFEGSGFRGAATVRERRD